NAFAAAGEAQALARGGLDADVVDVDAEVGGDEFAHRLRMRTHLRPLADHGDVGVAQAPATFAQQGVAVAQEHAAVRTLPARIRRRKMGADVAQRQRPQHRVAQRVQDHVAIAVRQHAALVRHAQAAEHHMVALAEGVDVVPLADAHGHGANRPAMRWMSTCSTTPALAAATPGSLNRLSPASCPTLRNARWNAISALPARNASAAWSAQSTVRKRSSTPAMLRFASSRCASLTRDMPARSGCRASAENIHCASTRLSSSLAAATTHASSSPAGVCAHAHAPGANQA